MADSPERFQVGDDLYVMMLEVASLREQDVNAQAMQPRHFERLTENIRKRGQLESLPYCHWPGEEGPVSVVSGHHRVRAARAAGLTTIPALVDTQPMRSSEVIAKQIAHNELHGEPDLDVLAQLVGMIDNVDDLLATGLPDEQLPTADGDAGSLGTPNAEFDFQVASLLFLPAQFREFTAALDIIDRHSELVGVAKDDQFEAFAQAAHAYGLRSKVKNLATSIAILTRLAACEVEQMDGDGVKPGGDWTRTASLVGPEIPPAAAEVVRTALAKVAADGGLPDDQPWRALELLAADYLAGG